MNASVALTSGKRINGVWTCNNADGTAAPTPSRYLKDQCDNCCGGAADCVCECCDVAELDADVEVETVQ